MAGTTFNNLYITNLKLVKMKRYLLFSFLLGLTLLWGAGTAWAQQTVSGTVLDENSQPLPGVTIIVKGTTNGTTTDIDGKYSLSVSGAEAVLQFRYVGYTTQEITVGSQSTIDVSLALDAETLDEVVVIGYGEIEAKDATGSVASVGAKDFNKGVIASPEQLFQGKTAGVQITSTSGEPGAGVNIRIRGTSSVRGGNNPLFVIDGIPLSGGDVSGGTSDIGRGSSPAKNPLNFINPNDIESIDILKDASATAIYGSRGANGVVIITTKSGKGLAGSGGSLDFSSSVSISSPASTYDLMNAAEFTAAVAQYGGTPNDNGFDTDWQDEVFRTAVSNTQNLSYSNGYDGGDYRVSLGYSKQNGIIEKTSLERLSGRVNWNHRLLNDKLKLGLSATASRVNDQAAPITQDAGFEGDLIGAMIMANPTWDSDPTVQPDNTIANPNSYLEYYDDNTETDRVLINLSAGYDITDNLNIKVNTGFDRSNSERGGGFSSELAIGNGIQGNGRAFIAELETASDLIEIFATHKKEVGKVRINSLLGYSFQHFRRKGANIQGLGFNSPNVDDNLRDLRTGVNAIQGVISGSYQQFMYGTNNFIVNRLFPEFVSEDIEDGLTPPASIPVTALSYDTYEEEDKLQSYFGRVNVSVDSKYLFTATVRADGSSRFGPNNQYGIFPSGAFAWRISDEDFMGNTFDDLKLRTGYGITGNQEIPHNLFQGRERWGGAGVNTSGEVFSPGQTVVATENPDLKWEQTIQMNVGLDISILKGRLSGTIDYYNKTTTDLLLLINFAQPSSVPFRYQNLDADVVNKGVEFTVNAVVVDKNDFNLSVGGNIATNDNEVKNFGAERQLITGAIRGQGLTGAFVQRIAEGQPLFSYYVQEFTGFNDAGLATYAGDADFTGQSPIPTLNYGLTLNASYKNFDLTASMNGQAGHYLYSNTANAFFTAGAVANNRNAINAVTATNESSSNAPDVSTRFIEKGDFLRMQNLALGYSFDVKEGSLFKALRFSVNAQNLFVLTSYSGLDPEVSNNAGNAQGVPSLNIDYTTYPRPRTFTFSLNATF